MPTVELHAVLVEYAEDGTAATETADGLLPSLLSVYGNRV